MSHKGGMYAVDRLLKDMRNSDETMGGVALLLEDFRQILHVCPRGTKTDELNECLKFFLIFFSFMGVDSQVNINYNSTSYW